MFENVAEHDAGPNDEERDRPQVPMRTSRARSSSSVSSAFDGERIGCAVASPAAVASREIFAGEF